MLKIPPVILNFMKKHNISENDVFDATGVKNYKDEMKILGKKYAINVSPHSKCGYQFKNRSGHCVICNPQSMAIKKRYHERAFVYIAGSFSGKIIKVGIAKNPSNRESSLRSGKEKYGSVDDWEMIFYGEFDNAADVEHEIQKELKDFYVSKYYTKGDNSQSTNELFKCDYNLAKEKYEIVKKEYAENFVNGSEKQCIKDYSKYNFSNHSDEIKIEKPFSTNFMIPNTTSNNHKLNSFDADKKKLEEDMLSLEKQRKELAEKTERLKNEKNSIERTISDLNAKVLERQNYLSSDLYKNHIAAKGFYKGFVWFLLFTIGGLLIYGSFIQTEKENKVKNVAQLYASIASSNKVNENLKKELNEIKAKNDSLESEKESLKKEFDSKTSEISQLNEKLTQTKSEIINTKNSNNSFTEYNWFYADEQSNIWHLTFEKGGKSSGKTLICIKERFKTYCRKGIYILDKNNITLTYTHVLYLPSPTYSHTRSGVSKLKIFCS